MRSYSYHTHIVHWEKYQDLYPTWLVMIELGMHVYRLQMLKSNILSLTAHSLVVFGNWEIPFILKGLTALMEIVIRSYRNPIRITFSYKLFSFLTRLSYNVVSGVHFEG